MAGTKKSVFLAMFEKIIRIEFAKTRASLRLTVVPGIAATDRAWSNQYQEGALDVRESRQRRDKIVPKFFAGKT